MIGVGVCTASCSHFEKWFWTIFLRVLISFLLCVIWKGWGKYSKMPHILQFRAYSLKNINYTLSSLKYGVNCVVRYAISARRNAEMRLYAVSRSQSRGQSRERMNKQRREWSLTQIQKYRLSMLKNASINWETCIGDSDYSILLGGQSIFAEYYTWI